VIVDPGFYTTAPAGPVFLQINGVNDSTVNILTISQDTRAAIVHMHYGTDGFIYVCVKDKQSGQDTAGALGRVVRVRPTTGEVVEWSMSGHPSYTAAGGFAQIPYCCNYFNGRLYVGTWPAAINEQASLGATDGTSALNEGTFSSTGTPHAFLSSFCQYNGRLFMGTGVWETTPSLASLWSRRPGDTFDATGFAWSAVVTASGAAAANGNYWSSMVEFNGALYAAWFTGGTTKIYKIVANNVGNPLSTSFTITTALNVGTIGQAVTMYVDDGILYAFGSNAGNTAYTTPDGTTWTSRGANLPAGGINNQWRPMFFAVNQ